MTAQRFLSILSVAALLAVACTARPSLDDARFACSSSTSCGSGWECRAGVCVAGGSASADGLGPSSQPDGMSSVSSALLDILWVVDNSTSMCQEQAGLAAAFDAFVSEVATFGAVDVRVAVTTTDVSPGVAGRFSQTPAIAFPPLCVTREVFPATTNLDCECGACGSWDEGDDRRAACLAAGECGTDALAETWVLESAVDEDEIRNTNGSLNTVCRLQCTGTDGETEPDDALCRSVLGEQSAFCAVFGGDWGSAACAVSPDTADCPADLPPVLPRVGAGGLASHGIEWFRCLATVGAQQGMASGLEQGLAAAWQALDPDGPNATQICDPTDPVLAVPGLTDRSRRDSCDRWFLRDGARLLIVFLTDEDDCSIAEGKHIAADDHSRCALLGDTSMAAEDVLTTPKSGASDTQPLAPVAVYAMRYLSLRPDPQHVFVAAIVGDAERPLRPEDDANDDGLLTGDEVAAARAAYYEAKLARGEHSMKTYVCHGAMGRADFGKRYVDLVESFGDHGFRANICSTSGFSVILSAMAEGVMDALFGR